MDKRRTIGLLLLSCFVGCQFRSIDTGQLSDDDDIPSTSAIIRITPSVQESIGIKTAKVSSQVLPNTLRTTGWLMTIPGNESIIRARVTGFYDPNPSDPRLQIGTQVTRGERLGRLRTALSPQEETQLVIAKEEADVLMNQALVSKKLAQNQLRGIQQNDANQAIAGTRLLELQETIERNDIAYREARDKLSYLPTEPYADEIILRPVPITAPLTGHVSAVNVTGNQLVIVGDPLWTVSNWSQLWIKVPVFVDDVSTISDDLPAIISLPGKLEPFSATPVDAIVAAAPGRRTVDVYYELANSDGKLRPGQSISIELPLGDLQEQRVVPRSAVVWGGNGDPIVYVRTAKDSFEPRQVQLGSGSKAVVAIKQGLEEGEEIVVRGAQAIYGEQHEEQLDVEDDD